MKHPIYRSFKKWIEYLQNTKIDTLVNSETLWGYGIVGLIVFVAIICIIMYGIEMATIVAGTIAIGLIFAIVKFMPHVKDVVVKVGRNLLDFTTAFDVVFSAAILIAGFFMCAYEDGISSTIWWYVLGSFLYLLATLVKDYVLYLLIDIRDSLKKLADKE